MARKPKETSGSQGRVRRSDIQPPVEFDGDPILWAAWLYYEESLTQEEIAERLGTSRATVVNLLQQARDRQLVTIAVAPEPMMSVQIARTVSRTFGLRGCMVVPDHDKRQPDYERIGRAGARALAEMLRPNDTLGVAWGRTVLVLSRALPALAQPNVTVVQIAGSAIATYEFSAELCTSNIASRIGARCVNLHAPGIVSRPAVKRILMEEPTLIQQFGIIRSCNKILFGVTNIDAKSVPFGSGLLSWEDSQSYIQRGAVGILAGRFLDASGAPVLGDIDDRMIGMTLEEIARVPERICVAGGPQKVEAIHATLRGGYATILITDERTARGLLALDDKRRVSVRLVKS